MLLQEISVVAPFNAFAPCRASLSGSDSSVTRAGGSSSWLRFASTDAGASGIPVDMFIELIAWQCIST